MRTLALPGLHWRQFRGVLALVAMLALKTGRSVPPREGGTASVRSWALYSAAGGRLRRDRVLFCESAPGHDLLQQRQRFHHIHVYTYMLGDHVVDTLQFLHGNVLCSKLSW